MPHHLWKSVGHCAKKYFANKNYGTLVQSMYYAMLIALVLFLAGWGRTSLVGEQSED